jgi:hypothetical protein
MPKTWRLTFRNANNVLREALNENDNPMDVIREMNREFPGSEMVSLSEVGGGFGAGQRQLDTHWAVKNREEREKQKSVSPKKSDDDDDDDVHGLDEMNAHMAGMGRGPSGPRTSRSERLDRKVKSNSNNKPSGPTRPSKPEEDEDEDDQ